jgi:hypothetical protein
VPASRGRGGRLALTVPLASGVGVRLLLGEIAGLGGGRLDGAGVEAIGSPPWAQPADAPSTAPAETSRNRLLETMPTIVLAAPRGIGGMPIVGVVYVLVSIPAALAVPIERPAGNTRLEMVRADLSFIPPRS